MTSLATADSRRSVASFDSPTAAWRSINDDVMGGVSTGSARMTDQKTLLFSGVLSLENRGGFASIRSDATGYQLDGAKAIVLRVRGDGRAYYLDLRSATTFAASSYRAGFTPRADEWQEIRLPLSDFRFSAFGRELPSAPLDPAAVRSIGFTIADKKAGPFRLEVAWIKAEGESTATTPAATTSEKPAASSNDIVATAIAAGNFKTLAKALEAAGLVDVLRGGGPFTVFAPTDEAFAKLPKGTVESLLQPGNRDKLVRILKHHVVQGRVSLPDALKAGEARMSSGQKVPIAFVDGRVVVDNAKLLAADLSASNGVIHVVDSVLLPEEPTAKEKAASLIELAIERGVPLFNKGQHDGCAAVYEITARALLDLPGDATGEKSRAALSAALDEAGKKSTATERAWTLRRALDVAYAEASR